MNVLIRDESMNGETLREYSVSLPAEKITVRELIRSRIYQEVKESNAQTASKKSNSENGFEIAVAERALNGSAPPSAPVDWQRQFEKVADAFCTNRIMIFVDDRQVRSLDETIEISPATKISFLRLTMLMGG